MASSTLQNFEQLGYGGPGGSMHRGKAVQVIGDAVATRTLLAKEAGATCLFDRAAGVVYTLPAPVIGMEFEFATTVTITSNSAKIITNSASVFIVGLVLVVGGTTETVASADFNGTTHVACTMNGTTTGGVIGDQIRLRAISSTQWVISGMASGSGVVATPAATS